MKFYYWVAYTFKDADGRIGNGATDFYATRLLILPWFGEAMKVLVDAIKCSNDEFEKVFVNNWKFIGVAFEGPLKIIVDFLSVLLIAALMLALAMFFVVALSLVGGL